MEKGNARDFLKSFFRWGFSGLPGVLAEELSGSDYAIDDR
jgi:hypothetical protein